MSKGQTFARDLLDLIFLTTTITSLAINATASPFTNLYVALHTADPGEAGDQTTSECNFTGYARVAVARSGSGWSRTASRISNVGTVTFPTCTAGTNTALWFSVGVAASGASKILYYGQLGAAATYQPFTALTSDVVTQVAHGFSVSDRVTFLTIPNATLPTGLTEGVVYFVKTVPDANTYTLSTTDGGATLDLTAVGSGVAMKVVPVVISTGNPVASFAAGALTIDED